MLEVELDIFSGRRNPKWILSEAEEKELLDMIISEPTQISPVYTPEEQFGLGYCGLIVREIKIDDGVWSRTNRTLESSIPSEFRVGSKPAKQALAAEWLLQTSENYEYSKVTDELRKVAARGVTLIKSMEEGVDVTGEGGVIIPTPGWELCNSGFYVNNIDYFNDPAHILLNNCYCFAGNHLADKRFALPSRRGVSYK